MKLTHLFASAIVASTIMCSAPAFASPYYTYSFYFQNDGSSSNSNDYGNVVISGYFTTGGPVGPPTSANPASSPISNIVGTVAAGNPTYITDGTIGGLSPWADADNILYNYGADNDYSFGGVSFNVGTTLYNLYDWNGETYLLSNLYDPVGYAQNGTSAGSTEPNAAAAIVSPVPEPASLAVLLLGLFGIGFMVRRARRKDAVVVA